MLLFQDEREFISQTDALDYLAVFPDFDEPDETFGRIDWAAATSEEDAALREGLRLEQKVGIAPLQLRVDDVWSELRRRAKVIGDRYPFAVTPTRVDLQRDSSVYRFLALLGARLLYELDDRVVSTSKPARLFESVVATALARLVGGTALRFGWPRRSGDVPSGFKPAVKKLCDLMKEQIGRHRSVSPDAKDQSLDVIAWRSFADSQPSQAVILCQCAIGKDWSEKHIEVDRWHSDVIEFANRPQNALAFVVHLPDQKSTLVRGTAGVGGILLDRTRIASLVSDSDLDVQVLQDIKDWVSGTASLLPGVSTDLAPARHLPRTRAQKRNRARSTNDPRKRAPARGRTAAGR